jgi:hypothetical protein
MASAIIDRCHKVNGDFSYGCTVRVKKNCAIIPREFRTFSKKESEKTWGRIKKDEIELNSIIHQEKKISIAQLLDLYINDADLWANTGRTKRYVIDMLRDFPIASVLANELKTSD